MCVRICVHVCIDAHVGRTEVYVRSLPQPLSTFPFVLLSHGLSLKLELIDFARLWPASFRNHTVSRALGHKHLAFYVGAGVLTSGL